MKEAMFYEKLEGKKVRCKLCPRNCVIANGKRGYCGVRENKNGKLYSLVFAKPCSMAIDPIEKKPFYHYMPGRRAFSIATVGCNLACKHCQNWEISQTPKLTGEIFGETVSVKRLVELIRESGVKLVSWTYTEPTVFFEYFYEVAKLTKGELRHNWVTNGFTSEEVAKVVARYIEAANVDYKGDDKFYREVCNAWLEPVRKTMLIYKKAGVWIEVTNLVIPGYNDSAEITREMAEWIARNLDEDTPLHVTAYYPAFRMGVPPTRVETLEKVAKVASEYLNFVYIGNVPHEKENTFCPDCGELLIKRRGFFVEKINLQKCDSDYCCPKCGRKIPIIME